LVSNKYIARKNIDKNIKINYYGERRERERGRREREREEREREEEGERDLKEILM
jgi:hypothetical protein